MKAMAQQSNRFFFHCDAKFGNTQMRMMLFADNVAVAAAIHVQSFLHVICTTRINTKEWKQFQFVTLYKSQYMLYWNANSSHNKTAILTKKIKTWDTWRHIDEHQIYQEFNCHSCSWIALIVLMSWKRNSARNLISLVVMELCPLTTTYTYTTRLLRASIEIDPLPTSN